jgi:hypothetical protein
VEAVFPGADIVEKCVDVYPVKVIVSAKVNGQSMSIWQGRQQDLFRKYAAKRSKAVEDIKAKLEILKEKMDL